VYQGDNDVEPVCTIPIFDEDTNIWALFQVQQAVEYTGADD
jgi:hypothetical protein